MVLTAYNVLSSVTGLFATVARRFLRELDASVGASGPHDFAVRSNVARPHALARDDAAASTASHPNVRDDRDTPLVGDETARISR
jgi:hypothetical protein